MPITSIRVIGGEIVNTISCIICNHCDPAISTNIGFCNDGSIGCESNRKYTIIINPEVGASIAVEVPGEGLSIGGTKKVISGDTTYQFDAGPQAIVWIISNHVSGSVTIDIPGHDHQILLHTFVKREFFLKGRSYIRIVKDGPDFAAEQFYFINKRSLVHQRIGTSVIVKITSDRDSVSSTSPNEGLNFAGAAVTNHPLAGIATEDINIGDSIPIKVRFDVAEIATDFFILYRCQTRESDLLDGNGVNAGRIVVASYIDPAGPVCRCANRLYLNGISDRDVSTNL